MPTNAAPAVIAALQDATSLHLTAIEHYVTLAEHLDRAGYHKLGDRFRHDADEERSHLRKVLERLEYYQTAPSYEHRAPAWPRYDVPGILVSNLALETAAAEAERAHIVTCRAAGDERSAIVFADLLEGSEDAIQQIEADRFVMSQIGTDNWLANQT
jgi:bacterioferritin